LKQARGLSAESEALAGAIDDAMRATTLPALEALRAQALGEHTLTVESCDNRERDMREFVQARIDADSKRIATLRDRIITAMQDYATTWPLDAREVDVSIKAAPESRRMLQVLEADDLPRFAGKFKELLNENTIREIAGFQSQLKRERETIRERVETINTSLHAIDYNPNRHIALEAEPSLDADLRDFQQDLRSCTQQCGARLHHGERSQWAGVSLYGCEHGGIRRRLRHRAAGAGRVGARQARRLLGRYRYPRFRHPRPPARVDARCPIGADG